jgi:hypothetical protein
MNATLVKIRNVRVTDRELAVELSDGRIVVAPLALYPTLKSASRSERSVFEVYPRSIHWPLLDVDLGVEGLVCGARELPCYAKRRRRATRQRPALAHPGR